MEISKGDAEKLLGMLDKWKRSAGEVTRILRLTREDAFYLTLVIHESGENLPDILRELDEVIENREGEYGAEQIASATRIASTIRRKLMEQGN